MRKQNQAGVKEAAGQDGPQFDSDNIGNTFTDDPFGEDELRDFEEDRSLADSEAQTKIEAKYPLIFWWRGRKKNKPLGENSIMYTGGLFYQNAPPSLSIPGWWRETITTDDGTELQGLATNKAYIAPVRWREGWFKEVGKTLLGCPRGSQNEKLPGKSFSILQVLCFLRGYSDPVLIQIKRTSSKQFLEAIKANGSVAFTANKTAKGQRFTHYAFWMGIAPKPHEMVGVDGSKSEVTYPQAILPPEITRDYALRVYIDRKKEGLLDYFQSFFHETAEWQNGIYRNQLELSETADEIVDAGAHNGHAAYQRAFTAQAPNSNYAPPPAYQSEPVYEDGYPPDWNTV